MALDQKEIQDTEKISDQGSQLVAADYEKKNTGFQPDEYFEYVQIDALLQ